VSGERKVMFISTFPPTFMVKMLFVEVYSNPVCVTDPGPEGFPIQVYAVSSTLMNPVQAVTRPLILKSVP